MLPGAVAIGAPRRTAMFEPRRTISRLASVGLLGAVALVASAEASHVRTAGAATPISLFAAASADGQGIVLTWSLTLLTLHAPGFALSRRAATDAPGSGSVIETAANAD